MSGLADPYTRLSTQELKEQVHLTRMALRAEREQEQSGWRRFAKFQRDPVGFITGPLGEFVYSAQRVICQSVLENQYTAVRSCHGAGKSFIASRLVCWWLSCWAPGEAFAVTTAPTGAQVRIILWREINRAHAAGDLPGRTNQTSWYIPTEGNEEIVGIGRKPADYDEQAFQGVHAGRVLVILDEAAGVSQTLWDGMEGLMTTDESRALAIGHPDDRQTAFGRCFATGSTWATLRIRAINTPNFTGEYVPPHVARLLVSKQWVRDKEVKWGPNHPYWQSRVEAEFPKTGERVLCEMGWVERAQERFHEWFDQLMPDADIADFKNYDGDLPGPREIGVDVAHFGPDETVIWLRFGRIAYLWEVSHQEDTMETTGRIIRCWKRWPGIERIKVDNVGVGAGVVDRLKELGYPVVAMNGGNASNKPELYANARSEWGWELREMFERGEIFCYPDEDSATQLTTIRYGVTSKGKIILESKEEMRKRRMPSPDRADGLCILFGMPPPETTKTKKKGKLRRARTVNR